MFGEPLRVNQIVLEHLLQDGSQQQQLGTRHGAEPEVGVSGQLHFPGVYDNERSAVAGGSFDRHAHHVVAFRQVGVKHQYAAGFFQIPNGIGGARIAENVFQAPGEGGLDVTGMIDVVGVHAGAGEFLGQVKLLVGAVGSGDQAETAAGLVRAQVLGNQIQRFFPCRVFQPTVATYHGPAQALAAGQVTEAKLPLVAGLAVVCGRVKLGNGANHPALLVDFEVHLAAHRAVGADGAFHPCGLFPFALAFGKSPDGADVYAGAAELTAGFQ